MTFPLGLLSAMGKETSGAQHLGRQHFYNKGMPGAVACDATLPHTLKTPLGENPTLLRHSGQLVRVEPGRRVPTHVRAGAVEAAIRALLGRGLGRRGGQRDVATLDQAGRAHLVTWVGVRVMDKGQGHGLMSGSGSGLGLGLGVGLGSESRSGSRSGPGFG